MPVESVPRSLAGRYVLHDEIASGGMATVHFGQLRGPAGFTKDVAIKHLHAHVAKEPGFATMLLDEARLTGRIEHPNVVATLDVIAVEEELFIVMEYVHGETLARLVRAARTRSAPVPPAVAVGILIGVLRGLHAAHEATSDRGEPLGIVHRDVSPQNILVGADGVPRVLDFGIAKAAGRLQSTTDGVVKGKVAYMAPEQIRGEQVDARTDVFASAVVLWETLTGERLFAGANPAESMARVLAGGAKPPSSRVPELPPALDDITLCGLAPNPDERFQSALAMANALENALPPATARRIGEWTHELAEDVLSARRRRWAQLHSERASVEEARPTIPEVPVDAPEHTASATFGTPDPSAPITPLRPSRWPVVLGVAAALGVATLVVARAGVMPTSTSPIVPSSAVATPSPVQVTPPPPAVPASVSGVAESSNPAPPSAPVASSSPRRRPSRVAPSTETSSAGAAALAAQSPPATASNPGTPHCHYDKLLGDAGIIVPVRVCD